MAIRITKRKIRVFVIVLLIILDIAIFFNGRSLSEDNCKVTFRSVKNSDSWDTPIKLGENKITIKLTELYDGLKDGRCKVIWTRTGGYAKNF